MAINDDELADALAAVVARAASVGRADTHSAAEPIELAGQAHSEHAQSQQAHPLHAHPQYAHPQCVHPQHAQFQFMHRGSPDLSLAGIARRARDEAESLDRAQSLVAHAVLAPTVAAAGEEFAASPVDMAHSTPAMPTSLVAGVNRSSATDPSMSVHAPLRHRSGRTVAVLSGKPRAAALAGAAAVVAAVLLWLAPDGRGPDAVARTLPAAESAITAVASASVAQIRAPGAQQPIAISALQALERAAPAVRRLEVSDADAQGAALPAALNTATHTATQATISVMRHDALQAARLTPQRQLEVIAPLALEPLLFFVRADSPLLYIHQIQGRRIHSGAPGSNRSLTLGHAYGQLFGRVLPLDPMPAASDAQAWEFLRSGKLDVVATVSYAAGLEAAGTALRLLTLDRRDPASQRALRNFLPTSVPNAALAGLAQGAAGGTTLGVMSFLVALRQPGDDAAAYDKAVSGLAGDLCRHWPVAHVARAELWQAVQPALQLDVGWPASSAARRVLERCRHGLSVDNARTTTVVGSLS